MKKIIILLVSALVCAQISFAQTKTVVGLSEKELSVLSSRNPDFRIDLGRYDPTVAQYFSSIDMAQAYIDSLRDVAKRMTYQEERSVPMNNGTQNKYAPCGCGDYSVNAGGAGLFSSFYFTFSYCNGNVTNPNLSVSGWQIGWSWGGVTSTVNGLNGCTSGIASFGIGIFSWSQVVHIRWYLNPNACTLYYSLDRGPCGITMGY